MVLDGKSTKQGTNQHGLCYQLHYKVHRIVFFSNTDGHVSSEKIQLD